MIKHRIIGFFIALISTGWLIPLWLSFNAYLSFWHNEGAPLLYGETPNSNSLPYLVFADDCFTTAMTWLGIVLFCWSYVAYAALSFRCRSLSDKRQ